MASDTTGLRQRGKGQSPESNKQLTESYLKAISQQSPASLRPYLEKVTPFIIATSALCEASIPVIHLVYARSLELWTSLAPYRLDLLIPGFIGLIMCFFGGTFLTLIAAAEAYRMCGWSTQVKLIRELAQDFEKVLDANKIDDEVDDNNDGVADVKQGTESELVKRKTLLFLRTLDPKRLGEVLSGLNQGFMAVIATLKLQFAKSIALGNAIGAILERPALAFVAPVLESILPQEYKKWAAPTISYTVRSAAISLAWFIQRIVSAFHSAMIGGHMFSKNICEYLNTMGYVNIKHEETYVDEIVGYGKYHFSWFLLFW